MEGVLTPEDAFVGALNSCFMLMFIWVTEKMKIDIISYTCEAIGRVEEHLDKTSVFSSITMRPKITTKGDELKVRHALELAEKYSLIWQSIKARIVLEPEIILKN